MAKVGEIFVATWGYDQTNATFFQVVGVTAKSVRVRKIRKRETNIKDGFMTALAVPIKHSFDGTAKTRRIYFYDGREMFQAGESFGSAEKWNGKPVHTSHYA